MSIVRAGLVMMLYLFIVLVCYFALSTPMELIFDTFDDMPGEHTAGQFNQVIPNLRTAWTMFIALLAAVPITWFICWVFSKEPDWSYDGRYR